MKLKELRVNRGVSQTKIADYLNITQEKYSRLENEKSNIKIEDLTKIADYYKVTIDEIVGHEVPYLLDLSSLSSEKIALIKQIAKVENDRIVERTESYLNGLLVAEDEKQAVIEQYRKKL